MAFLSNEATETSFSGILKDLERTLKDDYQAVVNYKTFENYYKSIVEKDEDYNIKRITLDDLSRYLEYDNFRDFCLDWKTIEYTITQTLSKIVINITNKPVFTMPEFLTKQGNLGIIGVILCGGLIVGSKMYKADETISVKPIENGLGILAVTKQCMYWNGKEYVPEDCGQPKDDLIAIDPKKIANFKKITKPDTISSVRGIWYSKYQNEVEFFTADGINPENGKSLNPLTDHILYKYTNQK